jgi:hypothetical protein
VTNTLENNLKEGRIYFQSIMAERGWSRRAHNMEFGK